MKKNPAFLFILFFAISVFPWGKTGHETIAYIAWQNLSPAAREKIRPLLEDMSIEEASIWADGYKRQHRNTTPWHYIDLPSRENFTAASIPQYCINDRHRDGDVVSQIRRDIEGLKNPSTNLPDRRKALWFLIHFIGDCQMPLHAADDNDRGGNGKKVRFFSPTSRSHRGHTTNLHSLWDNLIEVKAAEDPEQLGRTLNRRILAEQKSRWEKGTIDDWTFESYSFAKRYIYARLPEGPTDVVILLPKAYYSRMRPAVDEMLEKAGVRLARVLEDIYQ